MIAYAITDPTTLNFISLKKDIKRFFSKADMIVYRDKTTTTYTTNAKHFINEAKKYKFQKILLHTDFNLANRLGADGIHLKSTQFSDITKAKALGLFVVISTHTTQEALQAQKLGADMVTFSPIFTTPNKGKPKGIEVLKELISVLDTPVIALGGIVGKEEIGMCEDMGAVGFASIRYFSCIN